MASDQAKLGLSLIKAVAAGGAFKEALNEACFPALLVNFTSSSCTQRRRLIVADLTVLSAKLFSLPNWNPPPASSAFTFYPDNVGAKRRSRFDKIAF